MNPKPSFWVFSIFKRNYTFFVSFMECLRNNLPPQFLNAKLVFVSYPAIEDIEKLHWEKASVNESIVIALLGWFVIFKHSNFIPTFVAIFVTLKPYWSVVKYWCHNHLLIECQNNYFSFHFNCDQAIF